MWKVPLIFFKKILSFPNFSSLSVLDISSLRVSESRAVYRYEKPFVLGQTITNCTNQFFQVNKIDVVHDFSALDFFATTKFLNKDYEMIENFKLIFAADLVWAQSPPINGLCIN